ncbi:hypothetical protein [Bacillus thuringiensis]|uniref:hypothetical protein n=1 Tax=Bacillus thuringiensis TaxID=1428 RepID=UPI000BF6ADDE|nr:hypothetical protein [Bacillus thuringiensis]PFN83625.1 hypothetical protein COJ76_24025 [Bacillus thuringiensis]PGO16746.1 hypothetical protein CN974_19520 [Bacillus thuringiensis]
MTQLLTLIKNNLTSFIAIVTLILPILTYSGKTSFDLGFEERHTKFIAKCIKILVATVIMYFLFQIGSIVISLTIIPLEINTTIYNILVSIDAVSFIFVTLYWMLSMIKFATPKKYVKLLKVLSIFTKKSGFILYTVVFVSSVIIQSFAWRPVVFKILNGKFNIHFTLDLVQNLFISPLILTFVLLAILALHRMNHGKDKSYFYAMKIIDYSKIQEKELIHLYSRKVNEWVFVKKDDFHTQKTLYLYEKDKEKWYCFTKTEISETNN